MSFAKLGVRDRNQVNRSSLKPVLQEFIFYSISHHLHSD